MPGKGAKPEPPREAGWYPDPWSATGEGERYFDGKRWGTTERPRARHSVAEPIPIRSGKRKRRSGSGRIKARFANARVWIIVVLIVAGGIALSKYRSSSGSADAPSAREQAIAARFVPRSS